MDCFELTERAYGRVNFGQYSRLHPEGRELIRGWFRRALSEHQSPERAFEAFTFTWFALNGWAACVTGCDTDRQYLQILSREPSISEDFQRLLSLPDSPLLASLQRFASLWPIFEVKDLRRRRLLHHHAPTREAIIQYYFREGAKSFEAQCVFKHLERGENVPLDWRHTLSALYRIRCNLFHGEKSPHSEMDARIVTAAFDTLANFLVAIKYFERA